MPTSTAGGIRLTIDDATELKLLEERDAVELFTLVDSNREHLRRWLPWVDYNRSVEATRSFISASIEQYRNRNGFQMGVRVNGALVGVIGCHNCDWANRSTSIGYWLSAPFQGRGLMTKSCRTLLDYLFTKLGMNRIEIRCAVENKRSRSIPERLGCTQEGTLRQSQWLYDRFVDLIVYSTLRSDWLTKGHLEPRS